jgi:hypothetical protein
MGAATVVVVAIALYFTVLWGSDAARVLVSPSYGLDVFGRSRDVFSIGAALKLHGYALFRVAAFLGAFKLVGAVAFALHLADRARAFMTNRAPEHAMLEAGLLLVMLLILVAALPAVLQDNVPLLRVYGLNLLLASVAAMLNVHERRAWAAARRAAAVTATPAGRTALLRAMEEARAELAPTRARVLRVLNLAAARRVGADLDLLVRRWTHDFRTVIAGWPRRT